MVVPEGNDLFDRRPCSSIWILCFEKKSKFKQVVRGSFNLVSRSQRNFGENESLIMNCFLLIALSTQRKSDDLS